MATLWLHQQRHAVQTCCAVLVDSMQNEIVNRDGLYKVFYSFFFLSSTVSKGFLVVELQNQGRLCVHIMNRYYMSQVDRYVRYVSLINTGMSLLSIYT